MKRKGNTDPAARARAHMRAARKYYKLGDLARASAHYRRAMSFGTNLQYVSLRHGHDVFQITEGSSKTDLVVSDRDEADEAIRNRTSLIATVVPCNPLRPLGAFMGQSDIDTTHLDLRSSDYTHRVLSRWVASDENHAQARELASNVGLMQGSTVRTIQNVNYGAMQARDSSDPRSRITAVLGPRVYADAWVFTPTTLISQDFDQYNTALVFCPVPDKKHLSYRECVAWATYTAMYAAREKGSLVVILPMLHEDFETDVRWMLEYHKLPDGSRAPGLGLKKVIIIRGASGSAGAARHSGYSTDAPRVHDGAPFVPMTMGVLGYGESDAKAPRVDDDHVIVDPAGLRYISNNKPLNADQLSGAIYKFLKIRDFSPEVRNDIKRPGQAAYQAYDVDHRQVHVIHVVGPDFDKTPDILWHDAISALQEAYASVIRVAESLPADLKVIRVPLISGGAFSGKFKWCVPELTARAAVAAFRQHGPVRKEYWLCTFGDKGPYVRALQLAASVRHWDYKAASFAAGPSRQSGHKVAVSIVKHPLGTTGYAADVVAKNQRAKVGVMVAGNSGRPAGAIGDPLGNIPTIIHNTAWRAYEGNLKTQEESVVAEWLYGEYPDNNLQQERAREMLFRSTICGLWGQKKRQSKETIQGVDYTEARPDQYADAWVVRDAKLRHSYGAELRATLVFVAGPNAHPRDPPSRPSEYGSMWSTVNKLTLPHRERSKTGAADPYEFFKECVEASVRAGLMAMGEENVTHALVARVSCGVYAGEHKRRINDEFRDLVETVANDIAHLARFDEIVIVDKGSSDQTHYGVKPAFRPPDRKRDRVSDLSAQVTIEKTRRVRDVDSLRFERPGDCPACNGNSWTIDEKATPMWVCNGCRTKVPAHVSDVSTIESMLRNA